MPGQVIHYHTNQFTINVPMTGTEQVLNFQCQIQEPLLRVYSSLRKVLHHSKVKHYNTNQLTLNVPMTGTEQVLNLQCQATGTPTPSILWSREGAAPLKGNTLSY